MKIQSMCVYCGASDNAAEKHKITAREIGRGLAQRGIRVVYGGSTTGCMGQVADGALEAGGEVLGVFPQGTALPDEHAHQGVKLVRTDGMHARKQRMADEADAFVTLPGGLGSLDEFFEIVTWKRLKLHDKPVILYNPDAYYDPIFKQLENMAEDGLAHSYDKDLIISATNLGEFFSVIDNYPTGCERTDMPRTIVARTLRA